MLFTALLDANVLYNAAVRDTLLRAAEAGMYRPYWSQRILDEAVRSANRSGVMTDAQADRFVRALREAFESAWIEGYQSLEPAMTNNPKDRHVLAAAITAEAEILITFNLRHFPADACRPYGIEVLSPDQVLLFLWHADVPGMASILAQQAADIGYDLQRLKSRLRRDAPRFIEAVEQSSPLGPDLSP